MGRLCTLHITHLSKLPYDNPKIAGMYSFTLEELSATKSHVEPMVIELATLLQEIPSLKLRGPPTESSGETADLRPEK